MSGVSIALRGCAKTFADGTRALEPLDLDIASGETVVFLGPSGCGKTTTLRIIAGLEAPDAGGKVMFSGEDVTDLPIEKRNVGMVFQSYALFPNMSVTDNVAYGLRVKKTPKAECRARVADMLAMMEIRDLADRRIDQLSGGQRQRVALARAVAPAPRILLLDEPLTALDAKLRDTLRVEIDRLLRRLGITAIYVTHDQAEAMAIGDRVVVMSKGRVAQSGTPRDIYHRPVDRHVAEFIGTMNRLEGIVRPDHVETPLGRIPWTPPQRMAHDNAAIDLFFRPHGARLVAPTTGHIDGEIASALFLGDRTRLVVQAGTLSLIVDTADRAEHGIGERVGLELDTESLVAF